MKKVLVLSLIMGVAPRIAAMETSHDDHAEKALQYTNFVVAIKNGDYDEVVALHKAGVPLKGHETGTPLRFVVEYSEYITDDQVAKIADYLIDNGAEINLSPEELKRGVKPVIYDACVFGNAKMVEFLLKRGAKVDFESTGVDLLAQCFYGGWHSHEHKIVKLLVDAGCQLTKLEPEWLWDVAKIGDSACVKFLIQSGIGLRKNAKLGDHPLLIAARDRKWQIGKLLLEAGFIVSRNTYFTLCIKLLSECEQAYRGLIDEFERVVDESHRDEYKKVPQWCKDLVASQEVIDAYNKNNPGKEALKIIEDFQNNEDYDENELKKQALAAFKKIIPYDTIKNKLIDFDKASDQEVVRFVRKYQRVKIFDLVAYLKSEDDIKPSDKSEYTKFLNICEDIAAAYRTIDILKKYQTNSLSLKHQCLNKIRKLVKEGELPKEDLPKLDEFGFGRIVIPKENEDDNNNNEDL